MNLFERIRRFIAEVLGELRKVSWPGRRELIGSTAVVMLVSALAAAIVGLLDFIFSRLIAAILR